MATVEERNAELTKQLSLLKERNKQLGNIVDVEKDIVIKSKEIQTAADGVKQQYESVRESVFSGIESFTTGMFGGPIGGLINTLTIGSLKRRKENAKIEKEKAKEEAKKTAEENALRVKSLNVMAETLLQTDEYAGQTKEQVIEAIKARELQIEQNTLNEQIKNEKERALAFFKDENDAAEANGGEVSSSDKSIEVSAVESGGEVSSSPELGLIFDAVVESGEKIDISNKHLKVIADGVPTAEELEEARKKGKGGAAASGGAVASSALDDEVESGGGLLEWLGITAMIGNVKKWFQGFRKILGTSLFGKGGLFRNLKAIFLKSTKSAFGRTALKAILATMKIGSRLLGLAGVIIMPIVDGIIGFFKAEDWGVSKLSGVIGGVVAGGEGGILNAFMNAGKWAAIGATIGTPGGPPGMIAGGLIGAAIGGLLGWIGGDVIAKKLDMVGAWFGEQWDNVIQTLKDAWLAVMPKWFTEIDFEWSDILPPALSKLFNGEYFTIDFPTFHWYDIFPKFLQDWFKGTAEKISEKPFKWSDLLPQAIVDFFTGDMAKPDYSFKWEDLLPTFIVDIAKAATSAFKETKFTWESLLPNFIVKMVDGVQPTGKFEWRHLVPEFISKIIDAGKAAGTTKTGEFDWTRLLPDWMKSAWGAVVETKETVFNWAALLPGWLAAAWGDVKAAGKEIAEGTFDWKRLLPSWLHGAFDSTKAIKGFAEEGIITKRITDALDGIWEMIKEKFGAIIDKIWSLLPGAETVKEVTEAVTETFDAAKETVTKALENPTETIKNIGSSIGEGATNVGKKLLSFVPGYGDDNDTYKGGIVATRPTWLPSSGTVVGEHSTWQGRGAYGGGIPMDGPAEAIIPLGSDRAGVFIDPMARSIAGQIMNQLAMERISAGAGGGSAPTIITDNSTTVQNNDNSTRIPSPGGFMLPDEGRDFVHKVA